MTDQTPKDFFLDSLKRCSESEDFIPTFYKRFLATSDEIRDRFRFTDFEKQNKMLLHSLTLAAGATVGEPAALQELAERATTHDRDHLDIRPELYSFWLEAVIETAQEFDSLWNEQVESAWRKILGFVIDRMKRKY